MIILNEMLVEKQKLTSKDKENIQKLHEEKDELFKKILVWLEDQNKEKIKESGILLEEIEFKMQDAWKFERNSNMHTHWIENPACSCPIMDNKDAYPYHRIYTSGCLVHGDIFNKEN